MLKKTPLFEAHRRLGARLVEFGGWEMPVHYTGIIDEHLTVRTAAGLFDISHMGEVWVEGKAALTFLNQTLTNDVRKIAPGQAQYSLMCNSHGGVIDDLYVYCLAAERYLLIINASRIEADWAWLEARAAEYGSARDLRVRNASEEFGAVAVQGPATRSFIQSCFDLADASVALQASLNQLQKNQVTQALFAGREVFLACTGYTGEDGFEVVAPCDLIPAVWARLIAAGASHGLKPCGLGARDTLRTEMCYPLYGHELDENTTPIEAGLAFFVSLDKGDFAGRSVLLEQKARGVAKQCVAFKMAEKSAPPRPHYPILAATEGSQRLGEVTSGTQSPSLSVGIGLGFVPREFAKGGTGLLIEIRGKTAAAVVCSKPLYKRPV